MMQRDYIMRMIEQCGAALVRIVEMRKQHRLGEAVQTVDATADEVLGPLRRVVEAVDATTAVSVVGPFEVDRIRMYAALLSERAEIERTMQRGINARASCQRALELYAAISLAEGVLIPDDLVRIKALSDIVPTSELNAPFADEIGRILG